MGSAPKNQNVILIVVDQMRADCLSVLKHACVKTPNLDRLAKDGVLFENHFGQCTPCGPSRASLLTGLYMKNHRSVANKSPLAGRHTNLAKEVRKLGVVPALFGYTDTTQDPGQLNRNDPEYGSYETVMQGFDPVCRMESGRMYPWRAHLKQKGYPVGDNVKDVFEPDATVTDPDISNIRLPAIYAADDSDTSFLFDQLMGYLSVQHNDPQLCLLTPYRPHPPFVAPEPYNLMYSNCSLPKSGRSRRPEDDAAIHPLVGRLIETMRGAGHSLTGHDIDILAGAEDLEDVKAIYFGLITEIDDHVGHLLDFLKDTGQEEHTLVIFTSDHGELLGDHWLFGKRGYHDATVHVPLIVKDPRQAADSTRGRHVKEFTEHVDLLPTILDWFGGAHPASLDGTSLLPFVSDQAPPNWRTEAFWEYDFLELTDGAWRNDNHISSEECALCVIRDHEFKYVHFPSLPPLLFDIRNDPQETVNIAEDPQYQSVILKYARQMLNHQMLHCDRSLSG